MWHRPVFLLRDCGAESCFSFRETAQRGECVAALKLRFGKLRFDFERLFVERERLLEFAARVCTLSAFEHSDWIGRTVAEGIVLCGNAQSRACEEQPEARCDRQKSLQK